MIIPNINKIKNPKQHCYLGHVQLYGNDLFKTIDDVVEYYYSRDAEYNSFEPGCGLLRTCFMERDKNTPLFIKDVYNELNKHVEMFCSVGLIALHGDNGIKWHHDPENVIGMNIIGNTTWFFENDIEIKMTPGDLIYVPKTIKHSVHATEERFTIGFSWL